MHSGCWYQWQDFDHAFSAAILRGEGLKTALYTSPQLVRYPERMEVDGRVVSDEAFARGVSAAVEAGHRVNAHRVAAGSAPIPSRRLTC